MTNLEYYLNFIMFVLLGAGDIFCAIHNFKREKYFVFGTMVMLTIFNMAKLIQLVFVT